MVALLAAWIFKSTATEIGVGRGLCLRYLAHQRSTKSRLNRRGGRVVDRTALEMRHTRKRIGGSNPPLSARFFSEIIFRQFFSLGKTLCFLRLMRFTPDLRMQKISAFLFSSTGLRVLYYIFPYFGKVSTAFFSQGNSVGWRYSRS